MPPLIEIVPYKLGWPGEFHALAAELSQALGSRAVRVDHIGSTAVPNLAAKDVIDIQITVSTLPTSDEPDELDEPMAACGAERRPVASDHSPPGLSIDPSELQKLLYIVKSPHRRANVHIREEGRFNQRYALLCRDYLRAHPDAAAAYATIKHQLARHFGDDVDAYYDVKDPVFDLIMAAARDWSRATSWEPSPGVGQKRF